MVEIDGNSLTLDQIEAVAREGAPVRLSEKAVQQILDARKVIENIVAGGRMVYGVNTGFGRMSEVRIASDQVDALQLNLVRSHAAGVGEPFPIPVTRAITLLRANVLAKGNSGVRKEVVDLLLELLNRGIHPVIPSRGSVGASGDLAPLAHLALVLIGEGKALSRGRILTGAAALQEYNITPVVLQAKEGLALINGTQVMTAVGALSWMDAARLCKIADIAGALTVDVMRGTDTAFDERITAVRPHPGAVQVAANLRKLMHASGIRESHRESTHKVQDNYSLRCMPQVHGAVRDALATAQRWLAIEINSATDNPLVFAQDQILLSGGNFHGAPMALCFDFLAVALSQLASISERRIALLIDPKESELPPFLVTESGLNSGFMIPQVTAAALASENKVLAHPASVDTIPTSANKEDHVSMGVTAALKFQQIVDNAATILAIEFLCAAQALDLLSPLQTSKPLAAAHRVLRSKVAKLERDRVLSDDIKTVKTLLYSPEFLKEVESELGQTL